VEDWSARHDRRAKRHEPLVRPTHCQTRGGASFGPDAARKRSIPRPGAETQHLSAAQRCGVALGAASSCKHPVKRGTCCVEHRMRTGADASRSMYTCFCAPCAYGAMAENKNAPDGVPGKVRCCADAPPVPSAWLPLRVHAFCAALPSLERSPRVSGARRTGTSARPRYLVHGLYRWRILTLVSVCSGVQGSCVQGTLCFMLFPHLVQVRCMPVCCTLAADVGLTLLFLAARRSPTTPRARAKASRATASSTSWTRCSACVRARAALQSLAMCTF